MFGVHESYLYKLARQQRTRGHVEPLPHGGGATAKITAEHRALLAALVAQTPDATLAELRTQLRQKARVKVGITTVWRVLSELRLTLKKRPAAPPKRMMSRGKNSRAANDGCQSRS